MTIIKYKNLGISACTVQCVGESTRRLLAASEFSSYKVSHDGVIISIIEYRSLFSAF